MTRTNTLLIKTPEGVVFSQTLAGPVTRFLAWLVDFMCVAALLLVINTILGVLIVVSPEIGNAVAFIFSFVVPVCYAMTFEWIWRGQTIGKRIMRLRVVDGSGLRLRFSQVAIRNLVRVIDSPVFPLSLGEITIPLPTFYLIGGPVSFFTRKAQRLGDLAANTVVIRIPRITEPNLEQLAGDKYNSLRAYPHLCARLRQRVSPAEASTALQAIVRRDEFEAAARVQLFGDLAEHFKSKVAFPSEAIEGIADEQFVRNVVDVLYRTEIKRAPGVPPGTGSKREVESSLVA
jgi:uncharacterized RDD family membrane protein YckC